MSEIRELIEVESIKIINEEAKNIRAVWFIYGILLIYSLLTLLSISDTSLLLGGKIRLPLVDVDSDMYRAFIFLPLLFFFSHFALLVRAAEFVNRQQKMIAVLK